MDLPPQLWRAVLKRCDKDARMRVARVSPAWLTRVTAWFPRVAALLYPELGALLRHVPDPGPQWLGRLGDLTLSVTPSARFSRKRIVDVLALDDVPRRRKTVFIRHKWVAMWADPRELSYHNFENILTTRLPGAAARARETARDGDHLLLDLHLSGAVKGALDALEPLALAPPNPYQRGGKRVIFHDAQLAADLTTTLARFAPPVARAAFHAVNAVFRMNWFQPGEVFRPHYDTPFTHMRERLFSLFTLLVYLDEPGDGERVVLVLDGRAVRVPLAGVSAVVFPQRLEHAGVTVAARKRFLRTELIYRVEEGGVVPAPGASHLFNRAVYMTDTPSATALYQAAAAAHWRLPPPEGRPSPGGASPDPVPADVAVVRFGGVVWAADGHNFWFHRDTPVRAAAALVVLDFFKCLAKLTSRAAMPLARAVHELASPDNAVRPFQPRRLVKVIPPDKPGDARDACGCTRSCPVEGYTVCAEDLRRQFRDFLLGVRRGFCASVLGARVYMHAKNIHVSDHQIRFGRVDTPGINFAACQLMEGTFGTRPFGHAVPNDLPPLQHARRTVDGVDVLHISATFFDNAWCMTGPVAIDHPAKTPDTGLESFEPRVAACEPVHFPDADEEMWFSE